MAQGGPTWHIIVYYTHRDCFRAIRTLPDRYLALGSVSSSGSVSKTKNFNFAVVKIFSWIFQPRPSVKFQQHSPLTKRQPDTQIGPGDLGPIKTNVETDLIEDDTNLDANVAKKAKSKKLNSLNPENFTGPAANVFKQRFEYPPSKDDKVSNNKINKD